MHIVALCCSAPLLPYDLVVRLPLLVHTRVAPSVIPADSVPGGGRIAVRDRVRFPCIAPRDSPRWPLEEGSKSDHLAAQSAERNFESALMS
jgi:hypothetical protein